MIVKDEAHQLGRCLESVQPYADELIVVDTGSTDDTVKIAAEFGAKVFEFAWGNDFSAARNHSLDQACGSWILVLDADEVLRVETPDFKAQLQDRPEIEVYTLTRQEFATQSQFSPFRITRLFRNQSYLRYAEPFHEQLVSLRPEIPQVEHLPGLVIDHYGYGPDVMMSKIKSRNIPILEAIRASRGLSLTLLFALSDLYEATDQAAAAQACQEELFERILPHLLDNAPITNFPALPEALYRLGCKLLELEDWETVRLIGQRGLAWYPHYPPLNYLAGLFLNSLQFPLGASAYFQNCLDLGQTQTYDQSFPFNQAYMGQFAANMLSQCHPELSLQ